VAKECSPERLKETHVKSVQRKIVLLAAAALPIAAWAAPSVKIGTASFIAPSAANGYYPSATASTNSLGTSGRPNEIVELARALGNNADLIYDFVRNNVDTVWMYGLQKGALGALIDRSGTPFDQSHLMVELLRQANYTAEYQVGTITLSGAEFLAWTGISSATAACQLLASGGIPGAINGSTTADCNYGEAAVSSVQLSHIWVSVALPGGTFVFDPSYKPHDLKAGINLASVAAMTSGTALAQASEGMQSGAAAGAGYVANLNATSLNATLQSYGNNLLSYIQANFPAGEIEDVVGGSKITAFVTPANGLRQTLLPYATTPAPSVQRTWSGGIPDAYRTSLRVQVTKGDATGNYPTIFDNTLYVDEIYGRKLILTTDFGLNTWLKVVDETGVGVTVGTYTTNLNAGYMVGDITLTASHPYAAAADGTSVLAGTYMDATTVKHARYSTPLTIVHGWGDTGRGLVDKWGTRTDSSLPNSPSQGCETCGSGYFGSKGDGRREQLVASWLAQATRAARLHAAIAKSVYSLHHSIGIVAANTEIKTTNLNESEPGAPPVYVLTVVDSFDRIDVDSAFSLTSKSANAVERRAAVQAIAGTMEALEGSVAAQISDLPDTTSTATRFEWGNRPPVAEDEGPAPGAGTPRRFYEFGLATAPVNCLNGTPPPATCDLVKTERQLTSSDDGTHNHSQVDISIGETQSRRTHLTNAISDYALAGFNVVASEEAFLGPGQRASAFTQLGNTTLYTHRYSQQRGGALVATRYVGADPVEIAHVVIGPDEDWKGGGGGAQTIHQAQYDPSQAADVLKSRFVDRSKALGVDLQSGGLTYTSPASLTVGNGGFPYALTANLIWTGGNTRTSKFGPTSHVEPQTPWTTNWNNTLTVSGSGLEAMGDGDVRATAGTIAAFLAAQDVYKAAISSQREVAAVLVNAWWVRQLTGNVVTANVGTDTRQFVKLVDGTWALTGPGAYATLAQTGSRTVHTESCSGASYVQTRGWNYAGMSFQVTNANGDVQNFPYWATSFQDPSSTFCANQHGFRLSNWTFPFGVSINLVYAEPTPGSSLPELVEVNNSLGRKISFVQSGRGGFNNGLAGGDLRSVSVTTPVGSLDGDATHQDPSGAVTQFSASIVGGQHVLGQVFAANNASVPALQYTYDSLRRVKEARDAVTLQVGGRNPYEFFLADGLRGERLDPAGGRYTVFYDSRKRPFGYLDELGRTTSVQHDGRGRVTKYTYQEGDQETFGYDNHNNTTLLSRIAKPGSGLANISISAQWDQTWNKPIWILDAMNKQTDFLYFPSGNGKSLLQTATRPAPVGTAPRPVYSFTYNARGQMLVATDPTSLVTSNTYDPTMWNLLTTTADPATVNAITSFAHDAIGNVTSTTDPRNNVTEFAYDLNRQKTVTKHHDGGIGAALLAAERTTYDLLGRVTKEEGGTAFSSTSVTAWQTIEDVTYTATSKVYTETNGAGNTTTFGYDGMDRLTDRIDPLSRRTRFTYDAAGQLQVETRAHGTALQQAYATYTYTPNGQRRTVNDANNNLSTFEYDGFDRLERLRFPSPVLGATTSSTTDYEQYAYDPNGNRTSLRKRDGQIIGYAYDNLDRQRIKDIPGGTAGDVYTNYDLAGRPTYARFSNDTGPGIDYGYDTARRLTSETSFGRALAYQYDKNNNRTRLTYPDLQYISYEYDVLNRMTYVRENGATSGAGVLVKYQYDPLSRRDSLTRGNGTLSGFGYDLASRLTSLSQDLPGTNSDTTFGLGYTLASQLQSRSSTNVLYDMVAPAATVTDSYVPDGLNRYTSVKGVAFGYDGNQNLTSDGSRTFAYDVENRLTSVSGSPGVTLGYDPNGRLQQSTAAPSVTQYLYDGDRLTVEYDGSGNVLRRYAHGPGADEPIVWYEGATLATRRWLHADERGSVIAYTDGSGVGSTYTYGAYGEPSNWIGSRFRYTGQIMLPEAQLYHYKARVYDPGIGRFLQTDPVGYKDDFHLYAYVGGDPLNRADPSGTEGACVSYNNCANVVVTPQALSTVADFTPVLGDIKGVVEAIQNPSIVNVAAAIVGIVPEVGDVASKSLKAGANILENAAKGKAFEKAVLDSNGLKKNTETFSTSHGDTIPDSTTGAVSEVKASARVSDSAQLRAQREVAAEKGMDHNVYVQENAKVSGTVQRESTVIRCTKDGNPC
jgi:RHS repeat-associated protein